MNNHMHPIQFEKHDGTRNLDVYHMFLPNHIRSPLYKREPL